MLGFEVCFKDKVIHAAIGEDGVLPVIFDYCNNCICPEGNGTYLNIGGLASFEHLRWFTGDIDNVDQVVIRVADVKQASKLICSHPQERDELIKTYHSLKKELQEKRLI